MKKKKEVFVFKVTIYDENDKPVDFLNCYGTNERSAFRNYEAVKGKINCNFSYEAIKRL